MVEGNAHDISSPAPSGWVPVDRRWLGLDRRTIGPALVVLVLAVMTILVIPTVDGLVPAGRALPPGARIGLDGNVEFTPASGWTVEDGSVVGDTTRAGAYPPNAEVVKGATSLSVTTARYPGTAEQLLVQIESVAERTGSRSKFSGDAQTVRTTTGLSGVQTEVRTATSAGLVAAFVVDGYGVEVSVTAPRQPSRAAAAEVEAMVASFGTTEARR